jgi:hypothetical protein
MVTVAITYMNEIWNTTIVYWGGSSFLRNTLSYEAKVCMIVT